MSLVVSTDPADVDGRGADGETSRWSTRGEWFDWLVVSATLALALVSIWVGSSIVPGAWDYLLVSFLWAGMGVAWCVTVLLRTTDRVALFAVWALLIASFATILVLGPVTALIFFSTPSDWIVIGLLVAAPVGLLLVRQRPVRLVWFVAPAIVVASAALVFSDIARSARFAAAEAELTRYVQSLSQGTGSPNTDEPATVGGVPIIEVIREDGQVLLVTGYIGILGDDPAGLAYAPGGTPTGVGWEHISGPWYSWVPLGYVSDETD